MVCEGSAAYVETAWPPNKRWDPLWSLHHDWAQRIHRDQPFGQLGETYTPARSTWRKLPAYGYFEEGLGPGRESGLLDITPWGINIPQSSLADHSEYL